MPARPAGRPGRAASRWSRTRTRCTAAPWKTRSPQTLARTFVALGYVAARFNFRGVGASEGVHDRGFGETDDMEVMLDHMQQRYPGLPVALSGFSFGTFVQATLQQRLLAAGPRRSSAWCWSAPPPANGRCPTCRKTRILIHGEQDETITLTQVFDWARPQDLPVIVIPGADHFFHRKLGHIKNLVIQLWRTGRSAPNALRL